MNIVIIDGQGGGVGRTLVEKISERCKDAELIAVGTNSMATANMLRGNKIIAATGENAVVYNSKHADVIAGPMGIIMPNAMYGEITPKMAEAVAGSRARVFLIPMGKCPIQVMGVEEKKLADYVEEAVEAILSLSQPGTHF